MTLPAQHGSARPKMVIHCQYIYGIGHFARTKLLAAKFAEFFNVYLINGGEPIPHYSISASITYIEIPGIFKKESEQRLNPVDNNMTIEQCLDKRRKIISELLEAVRPDIVITEHFPFGLMFAEEVIGLLELAKRYNNRLLSLASVRDIISSSMGSADDAMTCDLLNKYFDALLVHSDEQVIPLSASFSLAQYIRIPNIHTGFVARKVARRTLHNSLPILLASIGGGRIGQELLEAVITAHDTISKRWRHRLVVFSGAFQKPTTTRSIDDKTHETVSLFQFSERNYLHYLARADLLVCMGGYNTVYEGVSLGLPMLAYSRPFQGNNQEQCLRTRLLEEKGLLTGLNKDELTSDDLNRKVSEALSNSSRMQHRIDFNGVDRSFETVMKLVAEQSA